MRIVLLEPFFTGSHKSWAEEYVSCSRHEITILHLSGHHWKWRMHGGAVSLAEKFLKLSFKPDLLLATDMMDLTTFLSLTRSGAHDLPVNFYFHENQLVYPWSPADKDMDLQRDNHYSFVNYTSALAADKIFFNSKYHFDSFFEELPKFLQGFPDHNDLHRVKELKEKSCVLHLGMDLKKLNREDLRQKVEKYSRAVILWNHRWEYDKNPENFFNALFEIKSRGVEFKLVVLGEKFPRYPEIFDEVQERLQDEILQFGYAADEEEYVRWLYTSDILPVTSNQDFFGASVVQAMYCNVIPLLPKRLAYPEHIPQQLHSTFFYEEDHREFVNRLQRMIFDVKILRKQQVRQFVEKYDWKTMVTLYDEEMERIVKNYEG